MKAILLQGVAFPFRQRVHDFSRALVLLLDSEGNGALYAVQVVVETRFRGDKKRRGDPKQIKLLCQCLLKKVLDRLDGDLCVIEAQLRFVIGWYVQMFHKIYSCSLF